MNFTRAFTATAMCSPSRATFLTGKYPSRHGVTLTMTEGDLFPDTRNLPDVLRTVAGLAASGETPRGRLARAFARGLFRLGPKSGNEPELPPGIDTLATLLRERGYHVAIKGKWHLSKPVEGGKWSAADPERIERDYGFADWEPPDAGGDAKAETFGGGNAGTTHAGLGRGLHPPDGGMARPGGPPGAVLPRLLPRQPARRARLPVLLRAGRLRGGGVPRPGRAAAADDRRGPARQADRTGPHEARADVVHRSAQGAARAAGLRRLLRPPAPRRGREDRPASVGARRSRATRRRCAPAR